MTGVNAEHDDPLGRDYDFGTGVGARLFATLFLKDYPILRLGYSSVWTATVNGAKGHHVLHSPMVQLRFRLTRSVGVGADYIQLIRNSYYDDFPDVHRSFPTFKLNVTFSWLDSLHW